MQLPGLTSTLDIMWICAHCFSPHIPYPQKKTRVKHALVMSEQHLFTSTTSIKISESSPSEHKMVFERNPLSGGRVYTTRRQSCKFDFTYAFNKYMSRASFQLYAFHKSRTWHLGRHQKIRKICGKLFASLVAPSRRAERLIWSLWCPDVCLPCLLVAPLTFRTKF